MFGKHGDNLMGDLRIISNNKFREIIWKGPKYCGHKTNFNEAKDSIFHWFLKLIPSKQNILNLKLIIICRIHPLSTKDSLEELHQIFVVTPTDKTNGDAAVI